MVANTKPMNGPKRNQRYANAIVKSTNIGTTWKQIVSRSCVTDLPPVVACIRSEVVLLSWKSDDKLIMCAWEAVLKASYEYCSRGSQSHFRIQPIPAPPLMKSSKA